MDFPVFHFENLCSNSVVAKIAKYRGSVEGVRHDYNYPLQTMFERGYIGVITLIGRADGLWSIASSVRFTPYQMKGF